MTQGILVGTVSIEFVVSNKASKNQNSELQVKLYETMAS